MTGPGAGRRFAAADAAALLLFALLAAAFALGRGVVFQPFLFLDGDAAKLASWAAGLDHPERFAGDSTLGDPSDYRYYFTIHLPLLRWLNPLTGGYGNTFALLLAPHVLVQLASFYVLGRVLFASRRWALLLALITFPPVPLIVWETWGSQPDPIPRIGFQALLPLVLALLAAARATPAVWPAVMAALGLLIYVHPVSTPAWALAVWLGLWALHPSGGSPLRRLLAMFGLGLVFLAAAGPFLAIYLSNREYGSASPVPAEVVRRIGAALLPQAHFDAGLAVREFAALWLGWKGLLWVGAAAGAACVAQLRPRDRRLLAAVGLWIVAIALISFAVPFALQRIEAALDLAPVDILLVRNHRYLVMLALLLCVWGLAALDGALRPPRGPTWARPALAAAGAAFGIAWWIPHCPPELTSFAACLRQGSLACHPADWIPAAEAVEAVARETPPGARIYPTRFAHSLQIRFHALRPVVHSRWDAEVFLLGDHARLVEWYALHEEQLATRRLPTAELRVAAHLATAERLGAEYVLLDAQFRPARLPLASPAAPPHELVWANPQFALLRLLRPAAASRASDRGRAQETASLRSASRTSPARLPSGS